jgi:glycerol kinase
MNIPPSPFAAPYLLALDQGTSSSRSIIFDRHGQLVAMAQREFRQHFPRPGWVEHDPFEIWQSQLETAREALARAGLNASDIAALGITNQRETTLLWHRETGQPLGPAIVWQDRRTEPDCAALRERGLEPTFRAKTGLVLDAYFSGTKLAWLLNHTPGARAAAERGELAFGTVDTWLLWQLTGGSEASTRATALHATDVSNASRTLMFNIHTHAWDDELLQALGVPAPVLPAVLPSSHRYGHTTPELLGGRIAIGGVAGDQQSALFGQACFEPGLAKNTYGTGCFMLMHTGSHAQHSANGLITTCAAQVGSAPGYALEGSVFVGGAAVQWLRDGLRAIDSSAQIQALAESVPDSAGVMVVPAFTGLGAPYWNAQARGAILGLTRGSHLGHIARATLESIAFQSTALLQAMSRDAAQSGAAHPLTELRVDGGACRNDLLMQFQADLLGIPVVRPHIIETTALGAAYLAGLSCGVFESPTQLANQWRAERRFEPQMPRAQAQALMQGWDHAVRQVTAV